MIFIPKWFVMHNTFSTNMLCFDFPTSTLFCSQSGGEFSGFILQT